MGGNLGVTSSTPATAPSAPWWAPYIIGLVVLVLGVVMYLVRPDTVEVALVLVASGLTFLGVGHGALTAATSTTGGP